MNSKFCVEIKNIRAIRNATINLNGITVLAGENACGKSTIAKLLYGFVKTSIDFDKVLLKIYSRFVAEAISFLGEFLLLQSENCKKI